MDRVRLMSWCRSCVGGMHLPAFAAMEAGLFAEQSVEVEFVSGTIADMSLRGLSQRVAAVAAGEAEFALTAVPYLFSAQADADGSLAARFAAVAHQRNPIVAVVRDDSEIHQPADLPRARAAKWCIPWFTQEYVGALERMGLGRATVVESSATRDLETTGGLTRALREGEIDVLPTWMDMTPYHTDAGFATRIIPLNIEVYSTGLLAADCVPLELVTRMRDAFVAGYDVQRDDPEPGFAAFCRRFPRISDAHIRRNWALFEPAAFDGVPPGSMDAERWLATIDHTADTHGLPVFPPESIYRPELLISTLEPACA